MTMLRWGIICQVLATLVTVSPPVDSVYVNPSLPADDFYQQGDILLGAMSPIYQVVPGHVCAVSKINGYFLQSIHGAIFMMKEINRSPEILPNITLGFVILNDCDRDSVAVAKGTKFITNQPSSPQSDSSRVAMVNVDKSVYHKVVGFMCPYSSSMSVPVSSLLSLYQIPHISRAASSEELSDKARFAYFSRVITPDQYIAEAIVSILQRFNWTYISTLHTEGSYGVNGIRRVQQLARKNDICIAYSRELKADDTSADLDGVIKQLRGHPNASVVVMFIVAYHVDPWMRAIARNGAAAEFILLTGDGFDPVPSLYPFAVNTFVVAWNVAGYSQEFKNYYSALSPWRNASGNPWYGEYTPDDVSCSWDVPEDSEASCYKYKKMSDISSFNMNHYSVFTMDIFKTFGLALHNLIMENCPEAVYNKEALDSCITGPKYLQYIRNVKFQGLSGWIEFDDKGDLLGTYRILQLQQKQQGSYEFFRLGTWDRQSDNLNISEQLIQWFRPSADKGSAEVAHKTTLIPESICAKPCKIGEFYIQGELKCCWECRHCRNNERVREDSQGCVTCPETTWPEQTNLSYCIPLPPTYLQWLDPIALALLALAALGFGTSLCICYIFIKHLNRKVIKGSNRELMAPILVGLLCAYLTVVAYVTKPTAWSCYTNYFGFNISCTLIFGPLFLKCTRLYRIFAAAERCQTGVRMVGTVSQVMLLLILTIIQVHSTG